MSRIQIGLPDKFIFSTEIPIRIGDINRGNHLGHDAVLPMVEETRMRFLRSLGYAEDFGGIDFIVVDAGIMYKKQGFYGQTLKIELGISELTRKGFDLVYRISDAATGEEMFRVKTGVLFFDYGQQKVAPIPEEFRRKITERKS